MSELVATQISLSRKARGIKTGFRLVGYLAGKCLASHIAGNQEKALHHAPIRKARLLIRTPRQPMSDTQTSTASNNSLPTQPAQGQDFPALRRYHYRGTQHHARTISTAAVLRNWHRAIATGASVMRPGIAEPAEPPTEGA